MSTPNFTYKNVLFVLETRDEDGDDFVYEDAKENMIYELQAIAEKKKWNLQRVEKYQDQGVYFLEIDTKDQNATISLIARSGYYSDISFDYEIIVNNTDKYDEDGSDLPKETKRQIEVIIKQIIKVYDMYLTELNVDGIFSNGEAIYSIKNKKGKQTK